MKGSIDLAGNGFSRCVRTARSRTRHALNGARQQYGYQQKMSDQSSHGFDCAVDQCGESSPFYTFADKGCTLSDVGQVTLCLTKFGERQYRKSVTRLLVQATVSRRRLRPYFSGKNFCSVSSLGGRVTKETAIMAIVEPATRETTG